MTQSILNRELIERPELWRLSMLICEDALEVLARPVVGDGEAVAARLPYDGAPSSRAAALEEVIYANPLLLATFARTDIVVRDTAFMVVPSAALSDEVLATVMAMCAGGDESAAEPLVTPIDRHNSIVSALDCGIANFLRRTFDTCSPVHHLGVLARYFAGKSSLGNAGKTYINLRPQSMDVIAFNSIGLAAATTFETSEISDSVYYALAVARTAGLDPAADEFLISGDAGRRSRLTAELRRYAAYVMPAIFPSAMLAPGHAAMSAPFEIIVTPLCE